MNESIREILEEYKGYTEELIEVITVEDYDKMDELIGKRQIILNLIAKEEFDKEKLKSAYNELDILNLEKKLNLMSSEKKEKIRKEIDNVHRAKNGANVYNRGIYNRVSILNKQI